MNAISDVNVYQRRLARLIQIAEAIPADELDMRGWETCLLGRARLDIGFKAEGLFSEGFNQHMHRTNFAEGGRFFGLSMTESCRIFGYTMGTPYTGEDVKRERIGRIRDLLASRQIDMMVSV